MISLEKVSQILNWCIIISFGGIVLSTILKTPYPSADKILAELKQEPNQLEVEKEEFFFTHKNDVEYYVKPSHSYELWGMVISHNSHYSWWDNIFPVLGARVKDLCVAWGSNVEDLEKLKKFKFHNANYTCYYQTYDREAYGWFRNDKMSNNHIITDDKRVRKSILKSNIGDQIYFSGYLSEYGDGDTKRPIRGSSIVRNDTGDGACETIFVEDFRILKKNSNPVAQFFRYSSGLFLWFLLLKTGIFCYRVYDISRPRESRNK